MIERLTKLKVLAETKNAKLLLSVAAVIGLIVSYEAYYLIGKANPSISTPRYLISVRNVGIGRSVSPVDFDLILQTDVKNPPKGAISDQYLDKLRGAKIKLPLNPREILTWDHVAARNDVAGSIPKGLRAYQLELKTSVPLMGGDYVDVMANPKGKAYGSVLLLDKVLVIEATKKDDTQEVLLAVDPVDVTTIDKAKSVGEIHLILRNPEDKGKKAVKNRDFLKKKNNVEILSE